ISPQILAFFTKNLKGSEPAMAFTPLRLQRREDLQVTPTGQVVTAIPGETVYSLNRKRADGLLASRKPLSGKSDVQKLQTRLREDIHNLAGMSLSPGDAHPVVEIGSTTQHEGYRTQTITVKSDGDTTVSGRIAISDTAGIKRAVLMLDAQP